jgi:hypothetical protein
LSLGNACLRAATFYSPVHSGLVGNLGSRIDESEGKKAKYCFFGSATTQAISAPALGSLFFLGRDIHDTLD